MPTQSAQLRVLVTGASGFIGRAVVSRLVADGVATRAASRQPIVDLPPVVEATAGLSLGPGYDWRPALAGIDVVVHAAAHVHQMRNESPDARAEFHRVNSDGTRHLARQCVDAGVRRFVFLSSIKVNGERTRPGRPFTADDAPAPADAYGQSKLDAERSLTALAAATGLEVAIVRPVLVYGPGVRANVLSMMRWLDRGVPLPFGAIHNRRSLVGVDNLVDLLNVCVRHPAAANRIFLVSDGEDLSTPDLLRRMAAALGRSARLVPVPAVAIDAAASVLGRRDMARRLLDSLQVDITTTRTILGWAPPVSVGEGLARTAAAYRKQAAR